jgi:hypothetical protein
MTREFDPYHRWLGIRPEDQPPNHYRLLGLSLFEGDAEVIRDAAVQRIAHVRTYQLGPRQALSQQILNELAAAKNCLLSTESKAAYDLQLRQELAAAEIVQAPPVIHSDGHGADAIAKQRPSRLVLIAVAAGIAICLGAVALLLLIRPRQSEPQRAPAAVAERKAENNRRDPSPPVSPSPMPPIPLAGGIGVSREPETAGHSATPSPVPSPQSPIPSFPPAAAVGSSTGVSHAPPSPTPPAPADVPKLSAPPSVNDRTETLPSGASTNAPVSASFGGDPRPAKQFANRPESVANALRRRVSLYAPYGRFKVGVHDDKITVQNAVKTIIEQAGLSYDAKESVKNTDPTCRRWIHPNIRNMPCDAALKTILNRVGLSYEIADGKVVLNRR